MMRLNSIKYRAASIIFITQSIILLIALWQVQSLNFNESKRLMLAQDDTMIDLLANTAKRALFTEEFFHLQPFFKRFTDSKHVIQVFLENDESIIVASSTNSLLGLSPTKPINEQNSYWIIQAIEDGDEIIGTLHVHFSQRELQETHQKNYNYSLIIGFVGIIISALWSLLLAGLFSQRIIRITQTTENFSAGQIDSRIKLEGNDELTDLSKSWNSMADQLKHNISEIEHLAYHDALTGLSNRRDFDNRLEAAFKSAKQQGHFYALLYLDLDKFKLVNDTCGHHAGDQLLIELSELISKQLRNRDTLVRMGGDEFAILLENCSLSAAEDVAKKIVNAVFEFKFSWEDKILKVGVSIGIEILNEHTESIDTLLSSADAACFKAKQNGRNQVHLAMPDDSQLKEHFSDINWLSQLTKMVDQDKFKLAFQKIFSSRQQELMGIEFLLRAQNDQSKWDSPKLFIDAAERYNFMPRLDRYVIDKVFKIIAFNRQFSNYKRYFINLSGQSLSEDNLYHYVLDKLKQYSIDPNKIYFEITETAAIENFNKASIFIEKARALGCHFALDDFGSGMCSFTYLKNFQIDIVKIDGSFILNMHKNSVDHTIVESINRISQQAGYLTIAEFIENEKILHEVQKLEIDYCQGYQTHKPELIEI